MVQAATKPTREPQHVVACPLSKNPAEVGPLVKGSPAWDALRKIVTDEKGYYLFVEPQPSMFTAFCWSLLAVRLDGAALYGLEISSGQALLLAVPRHHATMREVAEGLTGAEGLDLDRIEETLAASGGVVFLGSREVVAQTSRELAELLG